jgi:hypothetical protein
VDSDGIWTDHIGRIRGGLGKEYARRATPPATP